MKNISKENKIVFKEKALNGSFSHTIRHYYKKHWKYTVVISFFLILTVISTIMTPILTLQMTTNIYIKNAQDQEVIEKIISMSKIPYWYIDWKILLGIYACMIVINGISLFIYQYLQSVLGRKIEVDLRNKSLQKLLKQDISYYSDKKTGELLTKIISDTQVVGDQTSSIPGNIFSSFWTFIAATAMMFVFDYTLASIAISCFFAIIIFLGLSYSIAKNKMKKSREVATVINGNITDKINNIRLIKATGTEKYEVENINKEHKEYYKASKEQGKTIGLMITILFAGLTIMQTLVIASAMILHSNGDVSEKSLFFSSTFPAFSLALGVMIGPIFAVIGCTIGIVQATVSGIRLSEIINSKSIMESHYDDGKIIEDLSGEIIFKDIQFAYPEKPNQLILPKFDFKFESGKSYAFVGETGSGKSTIAKLLLRFYDPTQGEILINGETNLKDVNLASYLKYVGYVEQEPQIIYGNVFDNVKYGIFDATNEQVIEACKKAQLHELIETWKDGYKTILGERGFMLSGGQKQRLVIARMFLKDPKVLILDEATSALDNIVEKEIQMKLDELMIGRTTFTIAHRLSTIKNVDKIIVLGPGKGIVQTGKFEELKKTPGHFKRIYEAGLMK